MSLDTNLILEFLQNVMGHKFEGDDTPPVPVAYKKKTRAEIARTDKLYKVLMAIEDADNDNWHDVVWEVNKLQTLTDDELRTLSEHINEVGLKQLVVWFMKEKPGYITPSNLHRNATMQWWTRRWAAPDLPELDFAKQSDGSVIVDLWHTKRGATGPTSFREFRSNYPTFFFGSKGEVYQNLESLQDYVDETEEDEDDRLYVKRGRFRFTPLLWFDDKKVEDLKQDTQKGSVVAKLVNSHFVLQNTTFDLMKEDNSTWKKSLYYETENVGSKKVAMPLRLDNNCVEDAKTPLSAGFHGTLAVDVSGMAGALLPPGNATPESKSVVIWDVPGSLQNEGPWERL
jgi:hypothetical protein